MPLTEFPDAARLAASGETDSIRVILKGVRSCGIRLLDLGSAS